MVGSLVNEQRNGCVPASANGSRHGNGLPEPREKRSDHSAIQHIDPFSVIVVKAADDPRSTAAKMRLANLEHRIPAHPVGIKTSADQGMVGPAVVVIYV